MGITIGDVLLTVGLSLLPGTKYERNLPAPILDRELISMFLFDVFDVSSGLISMVKSTSSYENLGWLVRWNWAFYSYYFHQGVRWDLSIFSC